MERDLTAVDDLFERDDFRRSLHEWQSTCDSTARLESRLYDHLADSYKDDRSISPNQIDERVEMDLEKSDEEFADWYYHDPEAIRLRQILTENERAIDDAKSQIIECGKSLDVDSFTLYGLRRHIGTKVASLLDTKNQVIRAQQDLSRVDSYLKSNSGNLLTYIGIGLGIYATRLGKGGIEFTDDNVVTIPVAKGHRVAMMSHSRDLPEMHFDYKLNISASDIHRYSDDRSITINDSWHSLLVIPNGIVLGNPSFTIGEVCEGPPVNRGSLDLEYYQMLFSRIQSVGHAASKVHVGAGIST